MIIHLLLGKELHIPLLTKKGSLVVDSSEQATSIGNRMIQSKKEPLVISGDVHVSTVEHAERHEVGDSCLRGEEEYSSGKLVSQPSVLLKNSITYFAPCSISNYLVFTLVQITSLSTPYPNANYATCINLIFSIKYHVFFAVVMTSFKPTKYSKAVKEEKSRKPMKIEIDTLERSDAWKLAILPPRKKSIECKWVISATSYTF